jgi:hypothetical protein
LGNILVISTGPVWTVQDTKEAEKNWMKEKTPVPRSEFAKIRYLDFEIQLKLDIVLN